MIPITLATCNGKITNSGECDTCFKPAMTSSNYCGRMIESEEKEEPKEIVSTEQLINESITAASKILLMAYYACDLKEGITGSIVNDHDNQLFLLEFNKMPNPKKMPSYLSQEIRKGIEAYITKFSTKAADGKFTKLMIDQANPWIDQYLTEQGF